MICYQAIETKYLGPTNYRGTRIKATAAAGALVFDYDHALNLADNHEAAARALLAKLEWDQDMAELHQGALPSGNYCFIVEYKR